MKKIILSALALLGMGTVANAQFSIYDKDGNVIFTMPETPAYLDIIYQQPMTGTENGHYWVDLGLTSGTLWATCNVGAETPESYGYEYAWGEVETKDIFDWDTYKYCNSYRSNYQNKIYILKYCNDGHSGTVDKKTKLDDADDVAVQKWGGKWKMPTEAQQKELFNEGYWVWTNTYNGKSVNGYIVFKAKSDSDKGEIVGSDGTPSASYDVVTDTHIFLPIAVSGSNSYWSSSLYKSICSNAYALYLYPSMVECYYKERDRNGLVRPVVPTGE